MNTMENLDASNKFFVGVQGDQIVIMNCTPRITKADALNLAAWLVVLADSDDSFGLMLEKVQNS